MVGNGELMSGHSFVRGSDNSSIRYRHPPYTLVNKSIFLLEFGKSAVCVMFSGRPNTNCFNADHNALKSVDEVFFGHFSKKKETD